MKDKNKQSNTVYNRKILRNWLKKKYKTNKIKLMWKNKEHYIPKHLR